MEWLTSNTFPAYPDIPWWGLFLIGGVMGVIFDKIFGGKKSKKK